jgi:CubicO group peptidase (beta-lactamase class C family)
MNSVLRRSLAALSVAVAATVAAPSAQQPPVFTPFGAIPVLDAYFEALRQQAGIPGMSVALVFEGQIVWEKGYGFQNLATRIRATPDTPYLVGDLTSTLSATLLLQCLEERRIEMDRPLRSYGFQVSEPEVTLRQLMSHTQAPSPAESFAYNMDRYNQLTAVMESCVPQPYRKTVAHRLLNRLAMKDSVPGTDIRDTGLALPEELWDPADLDKYRRVLERIALPYKIDGRGRAERVEPGLVSLTAAGGLVSTVRDLALFDRALDDGTLLLEETREMAWTPVMSASGAPLPIGLGWFVQSHRGQRVVWHFGHVTNAYSSMVIKLPARRLTLIMLANSDGLSAPFQLPAGNVTRSLFATVFLRLAT